MRKFLIIIILISIMPFITNCSGGASTTASNKGIVTSAVTTQSKYGYNWVYGTGAAAGTTSYSYVYRWGRNFGTALSGPFAGSTIFFF